MTTPIERRNPSTLIQAQVLFAVATLPWCWIFPARDCDGDEAAGGRFLRLTRLSSRGFFLHRVTLAGMEDIKKVGRVAGSAYLF